MPEPEPTAEEALARALSRTLGRAHQLPADNHGWEAPAREVLGELRAAGFFVWDLRRVDQEERDEEPVLREPAPVGPALTPDASGEAPPEEPSDSPWISSAEYHRLIEGGVLDGTIELLDGQVTLGGEPLVFGPAQARAAAALGVRVHSAVDAVLRDEEARREVQDRIRADDDAAARAARRAALERLVAADEAERGPLDPTLVAEVAAELRALDDELAAERDQGQRAPEPPSPGP